MKQPNADEIAMAERVAKLEQQLLERDARLQIYKEATDPFAYLINMSSGEIPYHKLSFENWHNLAKANCKLPGGVKSWLAAHDKALLDEAFYFNGLWVDEVTGEISDRCQTEHCIKLYQYSIERNQNEKT